MVVASTRGLTEFIEYELGVRSEDFEFRPVDRDRLPRSQSGERDASSGNSSCG